jgi:hypothetical protein
MARRRARPPDGTRRARRSRCVRSAEAALAKPISVVPIGTTFAKAQSNGSIEAPGEASMHIEIIGVVALELRETSQLDDARREVAT